MNEEASTASGVALQSDEPHLDEKVLELMKLPSFSNRPRISKRSATSLPRKTGAEGAALFPIFLKLAGRRCLVVGAGAVGQEKIESLMAAGASVTVVAPRATDTVRAWSAAGELRWEARNFAPADLEGIFLVVAATSVPAVNQQVFQEAQRRRVLMNAVDDPPRCDFYYGSVVRRGSLQITLSTHGKSPALAQRLRRELEKVYGPEYAAWVTELGLERQRLMESGMDAGKRRRLLHALASRESYEGFVRRSRATPNGEKSP